MHNFSVLAGQESIIYKTDQFGVYTEGQLDERTILLTNGTKPMNAQNNASRDINQMVMNSFFFNLNYDFDGRYAVDVNFRRDGSSKFAPDHRWANFYSFGAMWNAKAENFLKDVKWLSDLKVRASYGTSGNSGIGYYAYQGLLGSGNPYDGQPLSLIHI